MKLKFETKVLRDSLARVLPAVGKKGNLPVLEMVLMEVKGELLSLRCTDLEVTISTMCQVSVESAPKGGFCLPAKRLAAVLACHEEDEFIEFASGKGIEVIITAGDSETTMFRLGAAEFPLLPKLKDLEDVPALRGLGGMIVAVAPMASDDETNFKLNGVHVFATSDGVFVEATDGKRLARGTVSNPGTGVFSMILPTRLALLMAQCPGLEDASIDVGEGSVRMMAGATLITGKLIEAEYPNTNLVIPSEPAPWLRVNVPAFLEALEMCVPVAEKTSDQTVLVRWVPAAGGPGGVVEVSAVTKDVGSVRVAVPGAKLDVFHNDCQFNATFLREALERVGGGDIELHQADERSPLVVRGMGLVHVVMPMRTA